MSQERHPERAQSAVALIVPLLIVQIWLLSATLENMLQVIVLPVKQAYLGRR